MIKQFRLALAILLGALLVNTPLFAQSDNLRVAVANLSQDVNLLAQQLKSLRLELEDMQRENAKLRAQVAAATSNRGTQSQISSLSGAIETLRRELSPSR